MLHRIIEIRSGRGQGKRCTLNVYGPLPVSVDARGCGGRVRGAGRRAGAQLRRGAGPGGRTVQGLHRGAERGGVGLRRRGPVGPAGLRGHFRDAPDARSAFELHGPEELRADARAPGRALLRPRDFHSGRRRRRHRRQRVRGLAGLPARHAPRRRHREDRERRHQGLDERPGGGPAARAARHGGGHRAAPRRLRQADRHQGDARRDPHAHRARGVHARRHHGLRAHHRLRREHRSGARRGALPRSPSAA